MKEPGCTLTDVERYGQILGPTPRVRADGSFEDQTLEEAKRSRFHRFVTKVWIHEHSVPDAADELLRFDYSVLHAALEEYEALGGAVHRDGREGGTLFETWASHQLFGRCRYAVLLNETAAGSQPIDRIPRVALVSPAELGDMLMERLPLSNSGNEVEVPTLMDLGRSGHMIRLRARDGDALRYWDTWPGPSLLCDANNRKGLRATLASRDPVRWSITRGEFESAVQAVLLRTADLNGTRYGEALVSHAELMKSVTFGQFRLRPVQRVAVKCAMEADIYRTQLFGTPVQLDLAVNPDQFVQMAVIRTKPALVGRLAPMIAQLVAAVARDLAAGSDPMPDSAVIAPILQRAVQTQRPGTYVGKAIGIRVRLLDENGEAVARVEIAPA